MTLTLGQIRTGFNGFQQILDLDNQIAFEDHEINISNWIDANMCAPLGAILYRKKMGNIPICISNISLYVKSVLQSCRVGNLLTHAVYEIITPHLCGKIYFKNP